MFRRRGRFFAEPFVGYLASGGFLHMSSDSWGADWTIEGSVSESFSGSAAFGDRIAICRIHVAFGASRLMQFYFILLLLQLLLLL